MDDSIVRGTTLEKSILTTLDQLKPKRIIIVSSAPQIRFPDCYGIDMSKMKDFVAFRAAIALLKDQNKTYILDQVYAKCIDDPRGMVNHVKEVYNNFTNEQISEKIADIITSDAIKAEVKVIYQTVASLNVACPNHLGDWYFTGNFPTQGGVQVVNRSFVNFMQGKAVRAY